MPELHLANRVKELTTTEGTGAVSLGGALDGHQSFADSPITDGQTVAYLIRHRTLASEWEVGYGTFDATAGTLSRDTVLESPTDAKINFSSGDKIVFVGVAAEGVLLEGTAESISAVWDFAGGLNVGGVLLADGVGDIQDARVPVTAVTQHEAALSIAGPQVDSGILPDARIQESGVTQHEAALAIAGTQLTGTVPDARLSANVALLDAVQTFSADKAFGDDVAVQFGAAPDYWIEYESANTRLRLRSSDVDGVGTDGDLLRVPDGRQMLDVQDDILFAGTGFRSRVEAIAMMAVEDLEDELIQVTAGFGSARRLGVNTDAYSITNDVTDRTFDANATTTAELADVLATLIRDLGRDS